MISDVMEFIKTRDYQGIMTAIDFKKAFHSLNWNFFLKSLEFFGFGESLGWIKTFYKNISSCAINNGFSTPSFNLKRGVRQGDPLSPSLFIIVLELLAQSNKKEFIKEINTLLCSFVWKGKDKVKRTAFINPIEKGGLKMPNIESMIFAQSC